MPVNSFIGNIDNLVNVKPGSYFYAPEGKEDILEANIFRKIYEVVKGFFCGIDRSSNKVLNERLITLIKKNKGELTLYHLKNIRHAALLINRETKQINALIDHKISKLERKLAEPKKEESSQEISQKEIVEENAAEDSSKKLGFQEKEAGVVSDRALATSQEIVEPPALVLEEQAEELEQQEEESASINMQNPLITKDSNTMAEEIEILETASENEGSVSEQTPTAFQEIVEQPAQVPGEEAKEAFADDNVQNRSLVVENKEISKAGESRKQKLIKVAIVVTTISGLSLYEFLNSGYSYDYTQICLNDICNITETSQCRGNWFALQSIFTGNTECVRSSNQFMEHYRTGMLLTSLMSGVTAFFVLGELIYPQKKVDTAKIG